MAISCLISPVKGCATRLAFLRLHKQRPLQDSGIVTPAVNTRITLTHPGSEPAKSQGPWVVSAQPPSLTPAWARRCCPEPGHRPGRQALGRSASPSADKVLLRDRHVATPGTLLGLVRWIAALQEEKWGVCTGAGGMLAVSHIPTAAGSWPPCWMEPERAGLGPRHSGVGSSGRTCGVHQRSSKKQT